MRMRVGIGHDTHRLGADRPLRIGGVVVPHSTGAIGHSDADVLLHAITDALLGAVGAGDIGEWFPDDDPVNENADSGVLLRRVVNEALDRARIVNIDCIVFAQRPKLGDHKREIRRSVASLLRLPEDRVNVKAKTGERVGPIGREEAIAAEAVVLLELPVDG